MSMSNIRLENSTVLEQAFNYVFYYTQLCTFYC
uniref:Uncharacterized protein n=1 Tax=Anguilla anguilla TaxID=7936 RepID=A0A0E9RX32_ANGAN